MWTIGLLHIHNNRERKKETADRKYLFGLSIEMFFQHKKKKKLNEPLQMRFFVFLLATSFVFNDEFREQKKRINNCWFDCF